MSELLWIGSEIPTHHGRAEAVGISETVALLAFTSELTLGLILALDNLARASNKGRHLTWRGLQDEPQGEFLIEVDDLNLLNLYVPFWSLGRRLRRDPYTESWNYIKSSEPL